MLNLDDSLLDQKNEKKFKPKNLISFINLGLIIITFSLVIVSIVKAFTNIGTISKNKNSITSNKNELNEKINSIDKKINNLTKKNDEMNKLTSNEITNLYNLINKNIGSLSNRITVLENYKDSNDNSNFNNNISNNPDINNSSNNLDINSDSNSNEIENLKQRMNILENIYGADEELDPNDGQLIRGYSERMNNLETLINKNHSEYKVTKNKVANTDVKIKNSINKFFEDSIDNPIEKAVFRNISINNKLYAPNNVIISTVEGINFNNNINIKGNINVKDINNNNKISISNNGNISLENISIKGEILNENTIINANSIKLMTGTIAYFAKNTTPNGWLQCDGKSYSKYEYSDLFDQIGFSFGGGGSLFTLPDLRGVFIRSLNTSTATETGPKYDKGRQLEQVIQNSQNKSHIHVSQNSGLHKHTINESGIHTHTMDNNGNHKHSINDGGIHNHTMGDPADFSKYKMSTCWSAGNRDGVALNGSKCKHPHSGHGILSKNLAHTHSINNSIAHSHSMEANGNHDHIIHNSTGHIHEMSNSGNHNHIIEPQGGTESRPVNIALLACIKY